MQSNKSTTRTIRLEPELDSVLQGMATAERVSVSHIIRKCLYSAIDTDTGTRHAGTSATPAPSE